MLGVGGGGGMRGRGAVKLCPVLLEVTPLCLCYMTRANCIVHYYWYILCEYDTNNNTLLKSSFSHGFYEFPVTLLNAQVVSSLIKHMILIINQVLHTDIFYRQLPCEINHPIERQSNNLYL